MAVSARPRKANKRSIVGSMGLAPYEPAPEPDRPNYAHSNELRDFYLTRDGRLSRVSRINDVNGDDDSVSFVSSRPASVSTKNRSIRSPERRSLTRSNIRSPPPFETDEDQTSEKKGGLLSRRLPAALPSALPAIPLLGSKDRGSVAPPPTGRRRKYNKTFGKNASMARESDIASDDVVPIDDDYIDDDIVEEPPMLETPLVAKPRSKNGLRNGRTSAPPAIIHSSSDEARKGAPLDEVESPLEDEDEFDDTREALLAPQSAAVLKERSPQSRMLPTHVETDEEFGELPGQFSNAGRGAQAERDDLEPVDEDMQSAKKTGSIGRGGKVALAAGAGAAAVGAGAALGRESSARKSRKVEPADVVDEESPDHLVNSSSLVPGLTGGYLDENVPSLGLKAPSILDKSRKGSLRSRQTATESEQDEPNYTPRQKKAAADFAAARQEAIARGSSDRRSRPKSRQAVNVASVPETDSAEDVDAPVASGRKVLAQPRRSMDAKRTAGVTALNKNRSPELRQSDQTFERYEDPNEPLPPRTRRSMDVRRTADQLNGDARSRELKTRRSLDVGRRKTTKEKDADLDSRISRLEKRAGIAGGVAAAPLVADVAEEPARPQSRLSAREQRSRSRGVASRQSVREDPVNDGIVDSDDNERDGGFEADEESIVPPRDDEDSTRKGATSQQRSRSRNGLLAAGGLGAGAAALAGGAAMRSRNGTEKGSIMEEDASNVGYSEPEALSLYDEDQDILDNRSARDAPSLVAVEKPKSKKKKKKSSRSKEAGTMGLASGRKRNDVVEPLSPMQRHYLVKALVSLQMQKEWSELEKLGALTLYGHPFSLDRPQLKRVKHKNLDLDGELAHGDFADMADDPYGGYDGDEERKLEGLSEPLILRHMFHVHLESFPGLDKAPQKYWQKRIQPFFDEMAARNFSTSIERGETTTRHFFTLAMTRYLGAFFARGMGIRGKGELRGPGKGVPGSERWGKGKQWGKGTVKRGLDRPSRPDEELMERVDELFTGSEGEFWRRARKESHRIRRDWQAFKEYNIERETGIEETMQFLDIGNLRNLPPYYRNAEEYVRHFAAYLLHSLFVSSPNADDLFGVLKGIHALFPYWGAKQLLKVANAQTMIQGILSLLLARPAGAKSLVQRIVISVIGGQGDAIYKTCSQPLKKAIADEELCGKIEDYVRRGNRPEGKAIRNRAARTGQDVLATILLYAQGKQISESKKEEVLTMHDCFVNSPFVGSLDAAYPPKSRPAKEGRVPKLDPWTTSASDEENALKYARLRLFLREILKVRDRDQACQMASGSLVPSIIKESLDTVFYGPIKKIAEFSNLSDRLGDLQAFFDDLIHIRKAGENTLPDWIDLCARHENSLYFLFHECSPIMKPFTDWLQQGADYMALSTTDPANPANRQVKNVEINVEEMLRDATLTQEDVDFILDEIDELEEYTKWQKVRYELEMRKNFLLSTGAAIPPSGLSADNVPKSGNFRARLEDIDGLLRKLMDQEGVPIEDGLPRNEARGTEAKQFPWAWFEPIDPLHQHLDGIEIDDIAYTPTTVSPRVPALLHTRKALGPFRSVLRECLPAWREATATSVPSSGLPRYDVRSTMSGPDARKSSTLPRKSVSTQEPTDNAPKRKLSLPKLRLPFGRG